jgi:hypothetical protein
LQKPKLLIITGPQGSGNHLFSKILSVHPDVYGWQMKSYWEGHHEEPFSNYWRHPELLDQFPWHKYQYVFTSISCPYIKDKMPHIPNYKKFITEVEKYADVKIAIIGRDPTILKLQQERVRGTSTLKHFIQSIDVLLEYNPVFVSQELYQLYGNIYLQGLSQQLDFPIQSQPIHDDANAKYIKAVDEQPLDKEVKKVCQNS